MITISEEEEQSRATETEDGEEGRTSGGKGKQEAGGNTSWEGRNKSDQGSDLPI